MAGPARSGGRVPAMAASMPAHYGLQPALRRGFFEIGCRRQVSPEFGGRVKIPRFVAQGQGASDYRNRSGAVPARGVGMRGLPQSETPGKSPVLILTPDIRRSMFD